jgi:glycosyltransferase involved in cell wall biosynthesis
MKLLHVIDSLDFSGAARQLLLLGPVLAKAGWRVEVCCLGPGGPWAAGLRAAGVAVTELNWTRWFDPGALWALRQRLASTDVDVIHVWRRSTLRAVALVARDRLSRVVLSAPLPGRGALAWYDRWLLRQPRCLTVAGQSEQGLCEQLGLPAERLRVLPSAVAVERAGEACDPALDAYPQRIVGVGNLRPEQGFRYAVWAMDVLLYLFPDAHLLIVGEGPELPQLRALSHGLRNERNVHFLGHVPDVAAVLRGAAICWVPSRANVGRQVALEAMAAGCPVIAADVPCLREVIDDGRTGLLVPPGDVIALARRTRALFVDPALGPRLAAAARADVQARHGVATAAQQWQALYRSLAA